VETLIKPLGVPWHTCVTVQICAMAHLSMVFIFYSFTKTRAQEICIIVVISYTTTAYYIDKQW